MSKYVAGKVHLVVPMLLAFSIAACSGNASQGESAVVNYPVKWTDEFSMSNLVEGEPSISSQEDLRNLLGRPWYASIDVIKGDARAPEAIASCNDYFSVKGENLRVSRGQESSAFLELVVMCESTRLFVEATASAQSAIPAQPLTEELPERLPKSLALITSESEAQRIMTDPAISSWGDVNDITKMDRMSEHRVVYHLDSGQQTLSIHGRGDFNGDGDEDVLVSVQDTVEGGSYYDLRLFVLSVTESGEWVVDGQYPSR
ncbi:hypothetical protein ACJO2E_11100 [Marinobacter sp. M1N3S26]|uniref:hypothetical protein n=1 Tax=Marinobacter sp. M1N3S26 TaxID=3382299 RepID=UPI00387AADE9